MALNKAIPKGPRYVNGFDLETPYLTSSQRKSWHGFLRSLCPREACRLCGIGHLPHWLASGPNRRYLADYLSVRYPGRMSVREALIQAIKERRPDPKSERSPWWQAMHQIMPELERFSLLLNGGRPQPVNEVVIEKMDSESDETIEVIVACGEGQETMLSPA